MLNIKEIQKNIKNIRYSSHAAKEMLSEEFGEIYEKEIKETLLSGEVIEQYSDDKPYPSCLVYGRTNKKRPLHVVCTVIFKEERLYIITVYEPNPKKWINFRKRKK